MILEVTAESDKASALREAAQMAAEEVFQRKEEQMAAQMAMASAAQRSKEQDEARET